MDATRCLREEHQAILRVLDCFEIALERTRETGEVPPGAYAPFVEFFRSYADGCHHAKEERILFAALERSGMSLSGGPVAAMLNEHEIGRAHVTAVAERVPAAEAGDERAARGLLEHGLSFLAMLRNHIDKEEHCLFGMAERRVRSADLEALLRDYRHADADLQSREALERCRALAAELFERYGVAAVPLA